MGRVAGVSGLNLTGALDGTRFQAREVVSMLGLNGKLSYDQLKRILDLVQRPEDRNVGSSASHHVWGTYSLQDIAGTKVAIELLEHQYPSRRHPPRRSASCEVR